MASLSLGLAPASSAGQTASFDAIAAKASAAREAGRNEEALKLYRQGVKLRPEWDEGLWYIGSLLYELERWAEARQAFSAVLARSPDHAGARALEGLSEFQLGQHETALRTLLQARAAGVGKTPGIATPARYHTGILLTRFQEFEAGYAVLAEFALEQASSPQVIDAFGVNLLRMPMLPSEVPPEQRPLVQLAGRAAFAMAAREVSKAKTMLDELVAAHPAVPNVHYARGVFRLTESADQALEDFDREVKLVPSHVPARLQIAFERLRRGEAEAARPHAEQAVALDPQHFAARLALGQVLTETGDVQRGIEQLEVAIKLASASPQAHFVLARAYARAGRQAEADRARAEFLRLDQLARAQSSGSQSVGGIPSPGGPGRPR